jgi:cytochrome c oxidase subunit 2
MIRAVMLSLALSAVFGRADAYGEVAQGRSVYIYQGCGSCHGVDAEGSRTYQTPALAGREAWYLETQLRKLRSGVRGAHPKDEAGKIMAQIARSMDESTIRSVSQYLESLETPAPEHELTSGDVAAGRTLYRTCQTCHGRRGEGSRDLGAPGLGGLSDWYLVEQLKKFKSGVRGAHPQDAEGARMRSFAVKLRSEQAIEDVVAYIRTFK